MFKSNKLQKKTFSGVIIWSKFAFKNANLDQIMIPNFFARNFVFNKKCAEIPMFTMVLTNNLKSKLGPDNAPSEGQTWTR